MSKHNILTEEEFARYTPSERTIYHLESFVKNKNLKKKQVNILDWGCGRGRDVLWFKEQGYNTYGVDIDQKAIKNGIGLFKKRGYEDTFLSTIGPDGKTIFSDNFFHFTYSNQVFEHISNIESVAAELARITVNNGIGFHVYPAHRRIVEGHLYMPFVHWIPKYWIRKYLIFICVCLGREPKWAELTNCGLIEKTKAYFNYSTNKTFYRSYFTMKSVFEKNGFNVHFETINHPQLKNNKLVLSLTSYSMFKRIIQYLLLTFLTVELFIDRSNPKPK